jgi:hypothetical protein
LRKLLKKAPPEKHHLKSTAGKVLQVNDPWATVTLAAAMSG